MASLEKSEDEILGLETIDSSIELGSGNSKADEDITCLDEDMLLLNSPSPAHEPEGSGAEDLLQQPKKLSKGKIKLKPTASSSQVHGISDNDDELEIIDDDNDDVEEITDLNVSSSNSDDYNDDEDESELDEISEGSEAESDMCSEGSNSFMEGKINIFFCHGAFFLWNADDVQMLREECRIVGKLVGSLPRAPRQNNHLGLPLQLMPEEVKLLVDIEAAVVVEEEAASYKALSVREAAFQNVRANNYKIQQNLYKESRKEDVRKRMIDIIAGKKAKKRKLKDDCENGQVSTSGTKAKSKKKSAGKKSKATTSRDDDDSDDTENKDDGDKKSDSDDNLTVDDIISETGDTSEKHMLVQIFTENPWKRSLRPYVDWAYPSTDRELLRYLVFKDLWGKGFFLTSGAKFGGDFLVYPGDPARFHSHYIAICKTQMEELPCLDVVTYGRQASNVRKTALLCSVDRFKKVFYTSLQWTGLS